MHSTCKARVTRLRCLSVLRSYQAASAVTKHKGASTLCPVSREGSGQAKAGVTTAKETQQFIVINPIKYE